MTTTTTEHAPFVARSATHEEPRIARPAEPSAGDKLTDLLVKYRWALVVPIVLPASKLFELVWSVRSFYYQKWKSLPEEHDKRVRDIQEQIRAFHRSGGAGLLCTSRQGWQTVSTRVSEYKRKNTGIRVELHDILEVDTERRIVRVEPRVNMAQISERLNPLGWTLPVLPELDDLTAGGLLLGYGIEASSHKYGLFCDIVERVEIVLGNGDVVWCSREENADLFHALPMSYGALGILASIELRMIPCKPWVHLTYAPVYSLDEAVELFRNEITRDDPHEFVEAIMYSRDRGVVMLGDFADRPERGKANHVLRWYKPWFYKHVESFLDRGRGDDYIPLRQFYHRHSRSIYWEGELIVPFGNHPLFRYPLGWLMPPKIAFLKLTQGEKIRRYYEDKHVVQDALVPVEHLRKTIELFHEAFECYPLWLCPHRTTKTEPQGFMAPAPGTKEHEMFVDVGAWFAPGPVLRGERWDSRSAVRRFERFLREHRSYQCLYAVIEQTREEFRAMFDHTLYDKVRRKYGAEGVFMDVFDKVKRPDR